MNSGREQMEEARMHHGFGMCVPFYTVRYEDVIENSDLIEIKPRDINTDVHLGRAFNAFENEQAAAVIVNFCKQKNRWDSFKYADINAYCQETSTAATKGDFSFWGLLLYEFIAEDDCGNYYITKTFVNNCVESNKRNAKPATAT